MKMINLNYIIDLQLLLNRDHLEMDVKAVASRKLLFGKLDFECNNLISGEK